MFGLCDAGPVSPYNHSILAVRVTPTWRNWQTHTLTMTVAHHILYRHTSPWMQYINRVASSGVPLGYLTSIQEHPESSRAITVHQHLRHWLLVLPGHPYLCHHPGLSLGAVHYGAIPTYASRLAVGEAHHGMLLWGCHLRSIAWASICSG